MVGLVSLHILRWGVSGLAEWLPLQKGPSLFNDLFLLNSHLKQLIYPVTSLITVWCDITEMIVLWGGDWQIALSQLDENSCTEAFIFGSCRTLPRKIAGLQDKCPSLFICCIWTSDSPFSIQSVLPQISLQQTFAAINFPFLHTYMIFSSHTQFWIRISYGCSPVHKQLQLLDSYDLHLFYIFITHLVQNRSYGSWHHVAWQWLPDASIMLKRDAVSSSKMMVTPGRTMECHNWEDWIWFFTATKT